MINHVDACEMLKNLSWNFILIKNPSISRNLKANDSILPSAVKSALMEKRRVKVPSFIQLKRDLIFWKSSSLLRILFTKISLELDKKTKIPLLQVIANTF